MKKVLIAVAMSLVILGGSAFAAQPQDRPHERQMTEVRHDQGRYSHRRHRRHHILNTQTYRRSEPIRRDRPPR
jgi:hypothetical protein